MSVHEDGLGSSWDEASPDGDQPHGLDYRSLQHIKKAVRKRIEAEHSDFADATVGGIHIPGGCAVLGIEDGTATIVADGTLKGHGIAWDMTGGLWCSTAAAGASTTGDFTLVLINPNNQWAGGDITWAGEQDFNAPVCFSAVDISNSLDLTGALACGSTATITNTLTCSSKAAIASDCTISGILKTDGTAAEFGGSQGIGLFYDPTVESSNSDTSGAISIGNGFKMAWDQTSVNAGANNAIAHGLTKCYRVFVSFYDQTSNTAYGPIKPHSLGDVNFELFNPNGADLTVAWLAIGR